MTNEEAVKLIEHLRDAFDTPYQADHPWVGGSKNPAPSGTTFGDMYRAIDIVYRLARHYETMDADLRRRHKFVIELLEAANTST